jgi:hypothetical protein
MGLGLVVLGVFIFNTLDPMPSISKTLAGSTQGLVSASAPLLSSGRIANSEAFHRVAFASPVAASDHAQFRNPSVIEPGSGRRILTVTKRAKPLPVVFSSPRQSWSHLTERARRQIDSGFSPSSKWNQMVFHGSANRAGSAAQLSRLHLQIKGLKDGLAYHFVIGNGSATSDGEVEVGERWLKKLPSGGAEPDAMNAISICFIGDFHSTGPTKAQLEALDELVDYLMIKVGPLPVISHRELLGSEVTCLGPFFPEAQIMDALARHSD